MSRFMEKLNPPSAPPPNKHKTLKLLSDWALKLFDKSQKIYGNKKKSGKSRMKFGGERQQDWGEI